MSDRGHDVFVLAREDEYTERLRGLGVSVIPLNYKLNLVAIISDITKILRVIKAQDVDAVFSFTHICNLTFGTASFFSRFRFYPNIAGLGRAFSSGANPALRFLITKLYRCCLLRVDKVFFQNADDCAWAVKENLVDLNLTVRLPGSGVDLKKFPPVSALEL
ncbi:hypothetical protein N9K35_07285, partial [Pseudomonadales bacterium]|nr:hypothetical protein [Pseudomonadales bacterium]